MPSMAVHLILIILGSILLQTLAECPKEWHSYGGSCYHFIMNSQKNIDMAREECQKYGAGLVSVNSAGEDQFLTSYFGQNKLTGFTWYTSGEYIGKNRFQWMGDGKNLDNQIQFWANDALGNGTGNYIVYAYYNDQYKWIRGEGQVKRFSICEIPEVESFRIFTQQRSFDYGQHIKDMNNLQRGPKMNQEPMNVLAIASPKTSYMEFTAFGNPPPTYQWYQGTKEITSAVDSRYTLTNGRLSISTPKKGVDDTYYHCLASNNQGTIVSQKVLFSFGNLGEFLNTEREGVVAVQYEGTYLQCKPPNHKPAIRYQWAFKSTTSFVRPEKSPYIFMSRNGNLYFSEVTLSDSGPYYCIVALAGQEGFKEFNSHQTLLRTSLSIRLHVQNKGAKNIEPQMHADFPSIYPEQPLANAAVYVECFAFGTYALRYSWSRIDGKMPSNVIFRDHNRVMVFLKATVNDSGIYNCRVTNGFGSASTNVSLDVKVKPYFKTQLKDQILDVGSQLTWRCQAHAKPVAVYSWYKNGKIITSVQGKMIVHNNVLTIFKVSESDNGMYQCEASNSFGSTFSAGQLIVLELKPDFWSHPLPESSLASISGNVTLECRPEAAPFPTIQWYKNGMALGLNPGSITDRLSLYYNGDLHIQNVMRSDAGRYKCEATNPLGSASTETELEVKDRIVISTAPRNTKVIFNETAVLRCRASYSKELDVIYSWLFNGHLIDVERDLYYKAGDNENRGDLYIRNAGFKHAGYYLCQVRSIMNAVSSGAHLTVIGPPERPQGLMATKDLNQKESLKLGWYDGIDNGAPITYYIIEYKTNFNNSWEMFGLAISKSMVEVDSQNSQLSTLIHGLIPAASYKFRMASINQYGSGEMSHPTSWIKIPADAPRKPPEEVGGGGGKVSTLVITWKPLSYQEQNGKNFGYQVFWRKKRKDSTADHIWLAANVSGSAKKLVVQVDSADYFTEYEVQVQAWNAIGLGPKSTIVTIFSAEGIPIITVTNVRGLAFNATAIKVTWQPVKEDRKSLQGKLLGYKIKYWRMDLSEIRAIEAIHYGQAKSAIIIGLQPNTYYNFRMMVFNSAGFGPISDPYFAKTYHKPPTDYPTEIYVYPHGSSSCMVKFRGVSTKSDEEPLQGYLVKYWLVNDDIRQAKIIDLGRNVEGIVPDLRKGVVYNLRVIGYSRGGEGAKSSPVTRFTITKNNQVQRDMFDPMNTQALIAGASQTMASLVLTMNCISILLAHLLI
ncbi:contactincontactin-like [Argonauta hians]